MAFYACMYFAALRPAEVTGPRRQDCHLPQARRGHLTLEKSRPEVNRRWTDTPATDVADRAGDSVEVLLRVYAKCLDDGEDLANSRVDAALRDA